MRDVIVTIMVMGTLPFILRNAYFGVLVWSWLSYMNPHRLAWGFAYDMPFAQIVAIILFISLLATSEKKSLPSNPLVFVWGAFILWMCVCTGMAIYTDLAMEQLETVVKIQLVTFVTLLLMKDFLRINQLIWVIVFSIGFYSVKGGIFTLITGGAFHVFGPAGSYIEENNTLAVTILMIMPMMVYLYKFPPHPLVGKIMPACIFLSLISVVGSQSRGAVLAILAVGGFFWWRSRAKLLTGILFLVLALFGFIFMPQSWHDRMATITEYQQDSSAMERLRAWKYSFNAANARITGAGFNSWSQENYAKWAPGTGRAYVAHSIYFSVLADSGWPGLIMFLAVLFMVWRQLGRVIRVTQDDPERQDYNFLARMLQISVMAYMSGGAFLSLSYFDLMWHIMAITVAMTQLTRGLSPTKSPGRHMRPMPPRSGAHGRGGRLPGRP